MIGEASDELRRSERHRITSGKADEQYEKYPEPQAGAEGSFGRFRITRAFDFDLDGTADVLEVNDRFAYWLDASGVPEVIQYGMGC